MKLSEFEKRHGKISNRFVSHYWDGKVASKYGLADDWTPERDLPAHNWNIVLNMSESILAINRSNMLEYVQNIFNYMASEKRKEVRDLFLRNMDGLYFSDFWGYFHKKQHDPKDYSAEERKEIVKVLKCIKRGYKKYRYTAPYTKYKSIDYYIINWGGRLSDKKAFEQATAKIQKADKLPRKLKKQAKKQGWFSQWFERAK